MITEVDGARLRLAYAQVFASEDGRIVMADLLRSFGFTTRSTYVPGDPGMSALHEGQRSVVVHIGRRLDGVAPEPDQQGEL